MNATPTYDGRADLIIHEPIGRVFLRAKIRERVKAGTTVRPE